MYSGAAQQLEGAPPEAAAATEVAAGDASTTGEQAVSDSTGQGLSHASVADDAANAVVETQWDTENGLSASQEWVEVKVPHDPSETETGLNGTSSAVDVTQSRSWADDQPEPVKQVSMIFFFPEKSFLLLLFPTAVPSVASAANFKDYRPSPLAPAMGTIRFSATRAARNAKAMVPGEAVDEESTVVVVAIAETVVGEAVGAAECPPDLAEMRSRLNFLAKKMLVPYFESLVAIIANGNLYIMSWWRWAGF